MNQISRAKRMKKLRWALADITIVIICLIFLFPVIIGFFNSFKSLKDVLLNPLSMDPDTMTLDNYVVAFSAMKYGSRFFNTLFVTCASCGLILFFASLAAYKLSRTRTVYSSLVYKFIFCFILIPFQCTMIPLIIQMTSMGLTNTHTGLILGYLGFMSPMTIFLYHGYIKTVPMELDEAARMDGCNSFGIFFRIIFPLIKPITATALIINAMSIWNDYLFPAIMIGSESKRTLIIGLTKFVTNYQKQWGRMLAATVMVITPILIVYIALQKYIIKGLTAGSVKA